MHCSEVSDNVDRKSIITYTCVCLHILVFWLKIDHRLTHGITTQGSHIVTMSLSS